MITVRCIYFHDDSLGKRDSLQLNRDSALLNGYAGAGRNNFGQESGTSEIGQIDGKAERSGRIIARRDTWCFEASIRPAVQKASKRKCLDISRNQDHGSVAVVHASMEAAVSGFVRNTDRRPGK